MERTVKGRRSYDGTRRRAEAERTKERVARAAGRLFVRRGYPVTTVDAIAEASGVPVQTIYSAFGTKAAILQYLEDTAVAGDAAEVSVADRDWMREALNAPDRRMLLRLHARNMRRLWERVGYLELIEREAASVDVGIAKQREIQAGLRRETLRLVIDRLAEMGPLRAGLDVEAAVDVMWAVVSPEFFGLLTRDRGWTLDQLEDWLAEALVALLLN